MEVHRYILDETNFNLIINNKKKSEVIIGNIPIVRGNKIRFMNEKLDEIEVTITDFRIYSTFNEMLNENINKVLPGRNNVIEGLLFYHSHKKESNYDIIVVDFI